MRLRFWKGLLLLALVLTVLVALPSFWHLLKQRSLARWCGFLALTMVLALGSSAFCGCAVEILSALSATFTDCCVACCGGCSALSAPCPVSAA